MKTCFLEKRTSRLPVSFRLQHICGYIYIYLYMPAILLLSCCVSCSLAPLSAWVSPEGRLYYLLDKTADTFTKRAVGQWRPAVQSPCAQFMDSIFYVQLSRFAVDRVSWDRWPVGLYFNTSFLCSLTMSMSMRMLIGKPLIVTAGQW